MIRKVHVVRKKVARKRKYVTKKTSSRAKDTEEDSDNDNQSENENHWVETVCDCEHYGIVFKNFLFILIRNDIGYNEFYMYFSNHYMLPISYHLASTQSVIAVIIYSWLMFIISMNFNYFSLKPS